MKYKTLNPVMHDGTLYPEGKALELDDTDADTLLACGAVAAMEAAEAEVTEPEPVKAAPKQKKAKGNK